ncbi:NrfD/PsrC family molybdoenzyme membrane anchor subunit [Azohydromonas sediminis]|uniref:NrfD/PsrC family molybdoenzyme membrane anchor subunit n=1 Tax=Azohydromonas sediminis TaxID=2259674 RepID=UPI000E64A1E9|nr:NrfD/PsrC family molybdoenzyme membrane anchor subunit [Azohydromonas sediminis]
MLEVTSTRHNPLVDPHLAVWSWEIPLYLFVGGMVAGMMVLAGLAMLRVARGDDGRGFFSMQTPLLGFMLLNVGMLALFLDLTHRWYAWRIFVTFQYTSPMAWGSWILIVVYAVLLVSALVRLPDAWPWLGRRLPVLHRVSDAIANRPARLRALGAANIVLGVGLGIYTGILLNTMVARPLWNSAVLGPLFLLSGLSAGTAMVHLASAVLPGRPAPSGPVGGAFASLIQAVGPNPPPKHTVDGLIRYDVVFLVVELILIALLVINLHTSSASHAHAAQLIMTGPYALPFWGIVVGLGLLVPIAWQALELSHRIPHTIVPAALVLVGGFTLRWVMVNAGQASAMVPVSQLVP